MKDKIQQTLFQHLPKVKQDKFYISCYISGIHDSSITIAQGYDILETIEFERFFNEKHCSLDVRDQASVSLHDIEILLDEINAYLKNRYTDHFEVGIYVEREYLVPFGNSSVHKIPVKRVFTAKKWLLVSHHLAHACGAFFQSQHADSTVITLDGKSLDGNCNIFSFRDNLIEHDCALRKGKSTDNYAHCGLLMPSIKRPKKLPQIEYPGKIMALAAYGEIDDFIVDCLKDYFSPLGVSDYQRIYKRLASKEIFLAEIDQTNRKKFRTGLSVSQITNEHTELSFAASAQKALEIVILELFENYVENPDSNICYAGGAALNVSINTVLKEKYKNLYIPPDPSDCGLSLGAMLFYLKPSKQYNNVYSGLPILDKILMPSYMRGFLEDNAKKYKFINIGKNLNYLARLLSKNCIVGVCRGNSERGPRALGNRSILGNPADDELKDKINSKIKDREWFRPVAPVIQEENLEKYFNCNYKSPYMTYAPKIKSEFYSIVPSIIHVDSTARVQTVSQDQNKWLHDLITKFKAITGHGVLANTSFNLNGKPIINSVKDCFEMLENTDLDAIVIDDILVMKK